jgi:hypothetical protein
MADTLSVYNHTAKKLLDLSMVDEAANFYVMLLDNTTEFSAAHTTVAAASDSGNDEVDGNGWTTGGENLENVAVTTVDTNDAMIDCDNVSVTATGGAIGPASAAIVYVDEGNAGTTLSPLFHVLFDSARTATEGNPFNVNIHANGLSRHTVT